MPKKKKKQTTTTEQGSEVTHHQWLNAYLTPLLGANIEGFLVVPGEVYGELWPVLRVRLADGKMMMVTVQRDEEGNGPGHLAIEPLGPCIP